MKTQGDKHMARLLGGLTAACLVLVIASLGSASQKTDAEISATYGHPAANAEQTNEGAARPREMAAEPVRASRNGPESSLEPTEVLPTPRTKVASKLKMTDVERIRIRVWGGVDIGGEYGVEPDLTLSIPILGRVDVSDLSPAELETLLSDRLSASTRRETRVGVEIVRSRPFFIMGQVGRPGAIEWRPGLNVIQAVALAGGIVRGTGTSADQGLVLMQTKSQLGFAIAQLARLKAEKNNAATISNSDQNEAPSLAAAGGAASDAYVAAQNKLLNEQRSVFQSRITSLEASRESALREIEAAQAQSDALTSQLEIARKSASALEQLKEKQLVANRTYLTQLSELTSVEARVAEFRGTLERAKWRAESIGQEIALAKKQREAQLSDRIESAEREIERLQLALGDNDRSDGSGLSTGVDCFIARNAEGNLETAPASVFSEVLPGDVVIVTLRTRTNSLSTERSRAQTRNAGLTSPTDFTQRVLEASMQARIQSGDPQLGTPAAQPR